MKFWAIAYNYDEDYFYNFKTNEETDLEEACLLPTEDMAKEFMEDHLSTSYTPVEIELEKLSKDGVWSYSRGKVEYWD